MRITVVTNRYPVDARDTASPFVGDFCRALEQLGHQPQVVTPFYPPERPERDPWVERFRWIDSERVLGQLPLRTAAGLIMAFKAFTAGRAAVLNAANKFRPDYILALWALPSGMWARTAARELNLPYGVWCLGSDIQLWGRKPVFKSIIRGILKQSSHLYADGFALADETGQLARKECRFLPSLHDLPAGANADTSHPFADTPYYLYFGRLAKDKGVLDLLAAAELLREKDSPRLIFAGTPDPDLDVAREIRARNLTSICEHIGPLEPPEIHRYMRHARAVLLPSHRDSIPLVFGEAMQCRTPVICSNLPDFRAVLQRYPVGTIASHPSPRVWAETLLSFDPNAYRREDMKHLCLDFGPLRAAETFIADVRDSLDQRRNRPAAAAEAERSYA